MSQTHTTDSGTASVACSERSSTPEADEFSEGKLVLVRYKDKETLIKLDYSDYDSFINAIDANYRADTDGDVGLIFERCLAGERWVTVTEDAWERQFDVIKDDFPLFRMTIERYDEDKTIQVTVKTLTGKTIIISVKSSATVAALKAAVQEHEGIPPDQQRLILDGEILEELEDGKTPLESGIDGDSLVYLVIKLRGGKPVIYLFPPTPLDSTSVSLTLTPKWHFSSLYPVVDPIKGGSGETRASWKVSAQPDGSLVDLASGLELEFLFWEAEAYKTTSSAPSHLAFDPSNPSLDASNGCALPSPNDFITYWLSHFVRIRDAGQHIGFRFLAQSDYERAARLDVDPKPDVVTRVFLLFKGVGAGEANEWRKPDEVDWVKEVGIQVDKVKDESLFRVLEWGGMEVV